MAVSKQQRVYDALKERLLSGVYCPGDRLVLAALARELEVSPVPVREAIRRLEAEGWLTYTRNVGATVGGVDTGGVEQALHVLALVEGYAVSLAATHMRKKDIVAARRVNNRMRRQLDARDVLEFSQLNRQFHLTLLEACPSDHVKAIVRMELERLDAMRHTLLAVVEQRARACVDEHEEIVGLIEKGARAVAIELAVREHELRLIDAYRQTFAETALGPVGG